MSQTPRSGPGVDVAIHRPFGAQDGVNPSRMRVCPLPSSMIAKRRSQQIDAAIRDPSGLLVLGGPPVH